MTTADTTTSPDTRRRLPAGWRWVRLRDIGPLIDGDWILNADYAPSGVRLIQVGDIGLGNFLDRSRRFITPDRARQLNCTLLETGDVLISRMPDPIGRACQLPKLSYPCITAVDVSIWRPRSDLADRQYVTCFLNSSEWLAGVQALASGATRPRISRSNLERLEIPLPPLVEQKRIAAILNEQMAAVERARAATEAQLQAAKALSAAHLRVVFNSPEAQRWPRKPMGEVGDIVSGVTLGRKTDGPTRSVPYLRVANVKDGYLDLSEVFQIEATEDEIRKLRLKRGDLLLTEGGDPDKLGRGTFWEEQVPECIHQNHIFRVRFDLERISPEFVASQIGSPYGKAYFLGHAKRTTGIATINRKVLAGFPLMVPPFAEQQHVALRVVERMAAAERLREELEEQLQTTEALPAALLRRAFSGEL